jgi:EAL domain-containing protein (putative c-di-GMP-specific phosphodiesterase class I)/GGDEF domain-containing protein
MVAGAALAVAPWPLALLYAAAAPGLAILACAAWSAAAFCWIAFALRPLAAVASGLRAMASTGPDAPDLEGAGDMEAVSRGVAYLTDRIHALQHRWAWRHPLTGFAIRESLVAAIAEDLAGDPPPTILGAIRFVDHGRLSAFDPATADAALRRLSERLAASLGPSRPIAHVDRDCFAIWFRGTEAEAAIVELKALCYALEAEIEAGEMAIVPEIGMGIARYPDDAREPAALINHALVSFARRGAIAAAADAVADPFLVARERFALEQDLRHAIDREQFAMVFQPVVDLAKGRMVGAEALLRWHHPEAGMVSPAKFIPILEDADLIDEIGRWTLNAACREARRWQRHGVKGIRVAVNLSATQLRDPNLKTVIERTLERHRLQPQALELELTETAAAEDAERTFALFGALRTLGVKLAIDDFGSGYSSLRYLKNLPFDKLKIDREFVVDVDKHKDSQAICRSLIELTRGLGLEVLAEGVENREEVRTLVRLGCNIFQGFYFSEPITSEQYMKTALDLRWRDRLGNLREPGQESNRMSA